MGSQQQRSRSLRKVKKKLPGGRVAIHYLKKKPQPAHCSKCGSVLHGVPRERPSQLQKIPKSQRRPERPYGGVLCANCLRQILIIQAREGVVSKHA